MYVRSPEAMKRMALSYDSLLADVYWIRAIQHYGDTKRSTARDQELRAAVSAARPHDLARSAVQRRLLVRRDLPRRAGPGRPRPARPGDRAPAERAQGAARQLAAAPGAGVRLLLVVRGLQDGGVLVRPGVQAPGCAGLDGAAGRRDAGAGRQPARVAADVAARRAERGRRVVPQRGACGACSNWTRSTQMDALQSRAGGVPGPHGAAGRGLGGARAGGAAARTSPRTPPACRIGS